MQRQSGMIWVLWPLLFWLATAVSAGQPAYRLDTGDGRLSPYVAQHCDPGGQLDLAAVRRLPFQPLHQTEISRGFRQPPCWFRFRVLNPDGEPARLILHADFNILDRLDLYQTDEAGQLLSRQRIGDAEPWGNRALPSRILAFPVTLPPVSEQEFFLRVETDSTFYVPLRLSRELDFAAATGLNEGLIGLIYGIAVGLLLYHLVLWLLSRDRTHGWYLAYVFFTLAFFLFEQGSLFRFWPDWPRWNNLALYSASFLMLASALMFSRSYLGTADRPRLHRILPGIAAVFLTLALLHPLLDTAWVAPANSVCGLFSILGLMVLGVARLRQGHREARLFLLSWGLLLGVGSLFIVMLNLGVPGIGSAILAAQAAFAAQQILLAIGMALRLRELQAESAAREQESRLARAESAAKSEFLARMSHEIRTPLNAMLGVAQLLEHDGEAEQRRGQLALLRQSGDQLLNIINDILDFSKIGSGRLELESVVFDLPALLAETGGLFRLQAGQKGLEFRMDCPADLPRWVRGDPTRLRQILFNLLGNAVKFTPTGHVSLRVEAFHEPDEPRVLCRFLVEDSGIGMDEAQVSRLFTAFHQADVSISRRYGGTGLGLAISKELADRMQAVLEVKSQPGQGSVFVLNLSLPLAAAPEAPPFPPVFPAVDRRRRLLVCEDNLVNQTIISAMLTRLGYPDHRLLADGKSALDALTGSHDNWDLVLMDCEMPGMDGLTVVQQLRTWETGRDVKRLPVIALTAHVMPEYRIRCAEAGMDGYLSKPLLLADLERLLRSSLPE